MKQCPQTFFRVFASLSLAAFPGTVGIAAELGKASILFTDPGTDLNPPLLNAIRDLAGYLNKNPRTQIQIGRTLEGSDADNATIVRTLRIFRAFADLGIDPARISFVQKAGRADGKVGITIVDPENATAEVTSRVMPGTTRELAGASFHVRYDAKGEPLLENDPGIKSFLLSAGQPGRDALVISVPKGTGGTQEEARNRAEARALGLYEILVRAGVPAGRLIVAEPKPGTGAATFLWTKNDAVAARVKAEDAQALQNPNVKGGLNLTAGMEKFREARVVQGADGKSAAGAAGAGATPGANESAAAGKAAGRLSGDGSQGMSLAARSGGVAGEAAEATARVGNEQAGSAAAADQGMNLVAGNQAVGANQSGTVNRNQAVGSGANQPAGTNQTGTVNHNQATGTGANLTGGNQQPAGANQTGPVNRNQAAGANANQPAGNQTGTVNRNATTGPSANQGEATNRNPAVESQNDNLKNETQAIQNPTEETSPDQTPKKTKTIKKTVVVKKSSPVTPDWTGVFSLGLASPRGGLASETNSAVAFGFGAERNIAKGKKDSIIRAGVALWHTTLSPKSNKLSGDLNLTALNLRADNVFNIYGYKPYFGLGLGAYQWDGAIKQKVTGLVHSKNTLDSGAQLHVGLDWSLSPQFILAPELALQKIGGAFSDTFLIFQIQARWKF